MNGELLKYVIIRNKRTVPEVAEMLNMSRQAFYNKLSGKTEFRLDEIRKIKDFCELTEQETTDIFLS